MNAPLLHGKPARRAAALALAVALSGCAPLIVGGIVVGTGVVASDRRTTGTQLEDETIEFKVAARVRELATLGQVSAHSYNRTVLLTGEVPGAREKAQAGEAAAKVENVRAVVNEIVLAGNSSFSSRSNDSLLAAKVKTTFVDAKDLHANAFMVVCERAVIFLMGRVTEREAQRATDLARAVPGVQKVVRVLEIVTEQELAAAGLVLPGTPAASAAAGK